MLPSRRTAGRLATARSTTLVMCLLAIGAVAPASARTPATGPAGESPGPLLTVSVAINDCGLGGNGVPQTPVADPPVTVTLKRGTTTRAKRTVPSSGGSWNVSLCPVLVRGGDILRIAANGQTRTVTVPRLSGHIDPFTRRISGKAPAGGSFTVNLWACQLMRNPGCFGLYGVADPARNAKHAWSVDLGGEDAWHPGFSDHLEITWLPTLAGGTCS